MACGTITYAILLNTRKVDLNWSLEAAIANYGFFFKIQVHSTRLEIESTLKKQKNKKVICECDVFTNTMLEPFEHHSTILFDQ